jgi:hypothetical protein
LIFIGNAIVLANDMDFIDQNAYIDPENMNMMLNDLNHGKITNISTQDFGFQYNSITTENPSYPIIGFILAEPYGRNIVPLIIEYEKKKLKTIAILDTSAPFVHLSESTMKSLGIGDSTHANVKIQGATAFVYRSTNHFAELNVLGASFFKSNRLVRAVFSRCKKRLQNKTKVKLTPFCCNLQNCCILSLSTETICKR